MRDLISSIDRWIEPEGRYKPSVRAAWAVIIAVLVGLFLAVLFLLVSRAEAHEATSVDGKPLGWDFPAICCHNRDCAVIPASTVQELPDGYHVTLLPGQHPMLTTKGYSGVIPYGQERPSPSGDYAICLAPEGARRLCFFAGDRGY